MSIYQELVSIDAKIRNHESDLLVQVTSEVKTIIDNYEYKQSVEFFRSIVDNTLWADIPFAYDLFWKKLTS